MKVSLRVAPEHLYPSPMFEVALTDVTLSQSELTKFTTVGNLPVSFTETSADDKGVRFYLQSYSEAQLLGWYFAGKAGEYLEDLAEPQLEELPPHEAGALYIAIGKACITSMMQPVDVLDDPSASGTLIHHLRSEGIDDDNAKRILRVAGYPYA